MSAASPGPPLVDGARPLDHLFDLLPHSVAVCSPAGALSATNRCWHDSQDDGDALIGSVGEDLVARLRGHQGPAAAVAEHMADGLERLLDGRGSSFQVQYELASHLDPAEPRWFLAVAERLPEGGLVITRTETTVHHGVHEVLAELAFQDRLTGLPNRGLVLDRIRMALIRAERLDLQPLIVFADLDGFKDVNDRHGHDAGDAVLVEAARRLTQAVRGSDTCGRWGGDEFILVVELGSRAAADDVIARIDQALDAPFDLPGGGSCRVGLSIGAVLAEGGERVEVLIAQADRAMYEAKRRRSGPVVFDSSR